MTCFGDYVYSVLDFYPIMAYTIILQCVIMHMDATECESCCVDYRKEAGKMALDLFRYNREVYEAMLRKQGKTAVIYPTGTGKSFIGVQFCLDNPESRVC